MEVRGRQSKVTIKVEGENWGNARHADIKRLLENVASHLIRHVREEISAVIEVRNWEGGPMILVRQQGQTSYQVMLTTTGRSWAQYSYQFAHELCHLVSNYERLEDSTNNWFHESICEVASLFTLRSMATTWESNPPYANWSSYAKSLRQYAVELANTVKKEIPGDHEVALWLQGHEAEGRVDRYSRKGNLILALLMLPVFEQHPEGWNAVRRLPRSDVSIGHYLVQWKEAVHSCERAFIDRMEYAIGIR